MGRRLKELGKSIINIYINPMQEIKKTKRDLKKSYISLKKEAKCRI